MTLVAYNLREIKTKAWKLRLDDLYSFSWLRFAIFKRVMDEQVQS